MSRRKRLRGRANIVSSVGRIVIGDSKNTQLFLNYLKNSSIFSFGEVDEFNDDGYPINGTLTVGRYHSVQNMPNTGTEYTGNWVLKWTGSGPMQIQGPGAPENGFTIVSGGAFVSGGTGFNISTTTGSNGRIEFSFDGDTTQINFGFLTGTYTDISNIILCRADQESLVDAGGIWNPEMVSKYQELRPKTLRPMGWTDPNSRQSSGQFAYRMPTTAVSWANRFATSAWVGDITGTDTYSCGPSTDNTTLVHLMAIQGKFLNDSTGVATLNFNGTGAKPIYGIETTAIPAGDIIHAYNPTGHVTMIYDAELNGGSGAWLWRPNGFEVGYPIEAICEFANLVNANLWLCFNTHDTDDCVQSKVALVRDTLDSHLTAYFEYSNEIWNFAAPFDQTNYAKQKGIRFGFTTNWEHQSWYGKRVAEIMPLVLSAWAPRTTAQLKRVMAFQASGDPTGMNTYRFTGSDLGAFGFNSAPNRPIDVCEVMSYATYYSGAQLSNFDANYANTMTDLLDAADDYDSGVPAQMTAALDWVDFDIREGVRNGSPGTETVTAMITRIYQDWNPHAITHNKDVECYEGGMECGAPSEARLTALGHSTAYSAKIATLLTAYKNDDRFRVLVKDQFDDFMAESKSATPAWLLLGGPSQWSTHPGEILWTTPYKSWDGMIEYVNGT
jgi:hypothetical protein